MGIEAIITMINTLVLGASRLGFNFQDVMNLQAKAESEGRELTLDDLKELRNQAQDKLDVLAVAIAEAEKPE